MKKIRVSKRVIIIKLYLIWYTFIIFISDSRVSLRKDKHFAWGNMWKNDKVESEASAIIKRQKCLWGWGSGEGRRNVPAASCSKTIGTPGIWELLRREGFDSPITWNFFLMGQVNLFLKGLSRHSIDIRLDISKS